MSTRLTKFEHFEWLDMQKPKKEMLTSDSLPFPVEINLLEDALEHGHLPKVEKQGQHLFIILRAFSVEPKYTAADVAKLTNKIAFLVNDKVLITIHQKPFTFLDQLADQHFESTEDLMLQIISLMLETFEAPLDWLSGKMDESEQEIFLSHHKKSPSTHSTTKRLKPESVEKSFNSLKMCSTNWKSNTKTNPNFRI